MSEENLGVDQSPIPENTDSKYRDYYEANKETEPAAGTAKADSTTAEVKNDTDVKQPPESSPGEQAKEHTPDWQRRIDKLTRRNKTYESELQALRKQVEDLKPKQPQQKLTKENFVSEEEYQEHIAKRVYEQQQEAMSKANAEQYESERKAMEQQQEFAKTWKDKTDRVFAGDKEGREQFENLLREVSSDEDFNLHQDIHDYIGDSDIGPRILHVLMLRPDLVERYNSLKPVTRGAALSRLEGEIISLMRGAVPQEQKPASNVSKAPAPIGPVGNHGARTEPSDEELLDQYYKKKNGR
jgi:hypothetical protein